MREGAQTVCCFRALIAAYRLKEYHEGFMKNFMRIGFYIACALFGIRSWAFASPVDPAAGSSLTEKPASENAEPAPRYVNLRINPIALVAGIYGGEVQVGFLPRWLAIGASISYFQNTTATNTRTTYIYEYAAVASFYLTGQRFRGGWLIQPGYHYLPVNTVQHSTATGRTGGADLTIPTYNYAITTTGGYEWAWVSGVNMHLGFGFATSPVDGSRTIEPFAIWQFGFAI